MMELINYLEQCRLANGQYFIRKNQDVLELFTNDHVNLTSPDTGWYWIHTNYSIDEFVEGSLFNKNDPGNMGEKARFHRNLNSVIRQNDADYYIVFNGFGTIDSSETLKTLIDTGDDFSRWKISLVPERQLLTEFPGLEGTSLKSRVEHCWRLHFGWPLFC